MLCGEVNTTRTFNPGCETAQPATHRVGRPATSAEVVYKIASA
jgi:hypothetical protein